MKELSANFMDVKEVVIIEWVGIVDIHLVGDLSPHVEMYGVKYAFSGDGHVNAHTEDGVLYLSQSYWWDPTQKLDLYVSSFIKVEIKLHDTVAHMEFKSRTSI